MFPMGPPEDLQQKTQLKHHQSFNSSSKQKKVASRRGRKTCIRGLAAAKDNVGVNVNPRGHLQKLTSSTLVPWSAVGCAKMNSKIPKKRSPPDFSHHVTHTGKKKPLEILSNPPPHVLTRRGPTLVSRVAIKRKKPSGGVFQDRQTIRGGLCEKIFFFFFRKTLFFRQKTTCCDFWGLPVELCFKKIYIIRFVKVCANPHGAGAYSLRVKKDVGIGFCLKSVGGFSPGCFCHCCFQCLIAPASSHFSRHNWWGGGYSASCLFIV